MKDIKRQDVKDLLAAFGNGELGGSREIPKVAATKSIVVKNSTGSALKTGAPFAIDGFSRTLSFDEALRKFLNNELYLSAREATSEDDEARIAVAVEPIGAGKIGKGKSDGVFGARVTFPTDGDSYRFVGVSFIAAESGPFLVLAKSSLNDARQAFCALARYRQWESAGSSIRIATLTTGFTQNSTRDATASVRLWSAGGTTLRTTATSPLSKAGATLASGTRVVVASIDGAYVIIQAEC